MKGNGRLREVYFNMGASTAYLHNDGNDTDLNKNFMF